MAFALADDSCAVGVSRTGALSAPARPEAANPSGKFCPLASTTVLTWLNVVVAIWAAVWYRSAPAMRAVVVPTSAVEGWTTISTMTGADIIAAAAAQTAILRALHRRPG